MAIKLKDRQKPGPNGYMFHEKRTGWKSWIVDPVSQWDFNLLVTRYQEHAQANPGLAMPTDRPTIENMMDLANALRYLQTPGADIYVTRDNAPKSTPHSLPQAVQAVAAGANVIIQWLKSGEQAVPAELSSARAKTCVTCPKHGQGDWTRYFTQPAAAAIALEYERRKQMKLSTPYDEQLQVCEACHCPLKLKVHMPLDRCLEGLKPEQRIQLDPRCWLLNEKNEILSEPLGQT